MTENRTPRYLRVHDVPSLSADTLKYLREHNGEGDVSEERDLEITEELYAAAAAIRQLHIRAKREGITSIQGLTPFHGGQR